MQMKTKETFNIDVSLPLTSGLKKLSINLK